ncbi:MAG TPA: hypothetical protein VLM79_30395 [Kofleriaceae bacterium]|nr:hypothetical protein [Kofleriaceae bacterium]
MRRPGPPPAVPSSSLEEAPQRCDEPVYTPTALDDRGRVYALNNGELFVIGN